MPLLRRVLIITGCRPVSALLFHGFGLPPWYDLPAIQSSRHYRLAMTKHVNRVAHQLQSAGFNHVDVHEAFPVSLMALDESLQLIRGMDRFLFSRRYAGMALLAPHCPSIPLQPRLKLIHSVRLNGAALDEADLLIAYCLRHGVPPVYTEVRKPYLRLSAGPGTVSLIRSKVFRRRFKLPGRVVIAMDNGVSFKNAAYFPGVASAGNGRLVAQVKNIDQLLDVYRFAGLLAQRACP